MHTYDLNSLFLIKEPSKRRANTDINNFAPMMNGLMF